MTYLWNMGMNDKITIKLVREKIDKFNKDNKSSESAISKLIEKFPKNNDFEEVLLKVSVINSLYSTNIYDIRAMAKHIKKQDIDTGLGKGEIEVVNKIARGHKIGAKSDDDDGIYLYSFATKYCSWHNPQKYPIYDRYVDEVLRKSYRNQNENVRFKNKDLKKYEKFKKILKNFRNYFKLGEEEELSVKDLDKFLWLYGKEMF